MRSRDWVRVVVSLGALLFVGFALGCEGGELADRQLKAAASESPKEPPPSLRPAGAFMNTKSQLYGYSVDMASLTWNAWLIGNLPGPAETPGGLAPHPTNYRKLYFLSSGVETGQTAQNLWEGYINVGGGVNWTFINTFPKPVEANSYYGGLGQPCLPGYPLETAAMDWDAGWVYGTWIYRLYPSTGVASADLYFTFDEIGGALTADLARDPSGNMRYASVSTWTHHVTTTYPANVVEIEPWGGTQGYAINPASNPGQWTMVIADGPSDLRVLNPDTGQTQALTYNGSEPVPWPIKDFSRMGGHCP
ncbi:MAG: hypothetical protein H6707_03925 [Deltaproteobacteria bacterium]|nr:hypothetical protein [Deltaproteobacteria bacterium]